MTTENIHAMDALKDAQAVVNTMQLLCNEIPQGTYITLRSDYLNDTLYHICQLLDIAEAEIDR